MRKRRSNVVVSRKRWAAYATAALAAGFSGQDVTADHQCILQFPDVELRDPEPGNGYFGRPFSMSIGYGGNVFFQHAYSELGAGVGILNVNASLTSSAQRLSIAGFVNGNYAYASNAYYSQAFSQLNFVPAGNRMDMAWGQNGYSNSQFQGRGGYVVLSFDVGGESWFGWMELELNSGPPANIYTLKTIYLTDESNGHVGVLPLDACPEPGSLGVLAMGAAGLIAWRRKRMA